MLATLAKIMLRMVSFNLQMKNLHVKVIGTAVNLKKISNTPFSSSPNLFRASVDTYHIVQQ